MKKPSSSEIMRLGVWGISFVIGLVVALLLVFVVFNTTMDHYGTAYFGLTIISVMFTVLIWLDYLAGTNILPD